MADAWVAEIEGGLPSRLRGVAAGVSTRAGGVHVNRAWVVAGPTALGLGNRDRQARDTAACGLALAACEHGLLPRACAVRRAPWLGEGLQLLCEWPGPGDPARGEGASWMSKWRSEMATKGKQDTSPFGTGFETVKRVPVPGQLPKSRQAAD